MAASERRPMQFAVEVVAKTDMPVEEMSLGNTLKIVLTFPKKKQKKQGPESIVYKEVVGR